MIHEQDGKRYFINGYNYYEIPDTRNKAFFKGKLFDFRDEVSEFMDSDLEQCIIPVFCESVVEKKSFKAVVIKTKTEEFNFTSSERGQYSYYRNDIKEMQTGNAYFIFIEKFARARNDFLIKATMKIEKE